MDNEDPTDTVKEELKDVITREVSLMRELLANMKEEQQAILKNDTDSLKVITKDRTPILDALFECRNRRNKTVKRLSRAAGIAALISDDLPSTTTQDAATSNDVTDCEILHLRDQILALVDQVKKQNERNSYLLQNKVYLTKEMIRRLYPDDHNATYSKQGILKPKKKTNTVMVINREV